ncbi:MAG: hypothetical protein KDC56_02415 [Flavobacteriaceae bacterium]|nr:hypothetical protein [Flavobacteriaceae bacterium]
MLSKCFITDAPVQTVSNSDFDGIFYYVEYGESKFFFKFHWDHFNSNFVEKNKHILQGLILNKKFQYDKNDNFYDNERLEKIIAEARVPKTPEEKKENLLMYLHTLQDYEGSPIKFSSVNDEIAKKLYFNNYKELVFFIYTLQDEGLFDLKELKHPTQLTSVK